MAPIITVITIVTGTLTIIRTVIDIRRKLARSLP
jgi:hypothetical protein